MSGDNAYTRTFRRAIETLGSAERLARALGASVAEIEAWAAGFADPPPGAFLQAIDIVAQAGLHSGSAAKS
jgi:DNA-binding transcriptional regulator YiaG